MKISSVLHIVIISCLFLVQVQAQTTYFVSLEVSDSNDGLSTATSWRTISYAAASMSPVTRGDTVYIKSGDYGFDDIYIDKN